MAGDAAEICRDDNEKYVSIHTRHEWRVMQYVYACACWLQRVSIHTRHEWRVMHGMP